MPIIPNNEADFIILFPKCTFSASKHMNVCAQDGIELHPFALCNHISPGRLSLANAELRAIIPADRHKHTHFCIQSHHFKKANKLEKEQSSYSATQGSPWFGDDGLANSAWPNDEQRTMPQAL